MTFNYYPPINRSQQFRVLVEAIATPITLEDFKAHAFVYDDDQDTILGRNPLLGTTDDCTILG